MNQLKLGALLNYIVIILNTLVGLLYTPYMLRMMGQSEYGLYSLVASVIAYLTVLDLGFGNAIVRYTAKYRAEGKVREQYEMFGMFLILYIVIGAISVIAGAGLFFNVDNLFGDTMSTSELRKAEIMIIILVLNLAFTFPMSIFTSIITAYERFVFTRIVNIIRVILNTLVMIALLEMGYKAISMVVVQTVFNILTLVLNYVYCKKELKIEIHFANFKWGFLKEVSIFSFWIFLNVIMDKVYWSTGQFILGSLSGTIAISIFAVAIQLHSLYMQFSSAISSVFLPKITSMVALKNDKTEISDLFIRTGRIQNILMILVTLGFALFGRPFIILWAGQEYADAYVITLIFFISLYIPMIQTIGITILQARNEMKFRSLLYIVIAAVSLFFQIVLAKDYSGIGCAIAIAGALFIGQGIVMNVYYQRKQNIDILCFWKEIARMDLVPIIVTILFMCYFYYFNIEIHSWVQLILWGSIYVLIVSIPFYKISFNNYEKQIILMPFKRIVNRI